MKLTKRQHRKCKDLNKIYIITDWRNRKKNRRNRYGVYIMAKTLLRKYNIGDWEIRLFDTMRYKSSLAETHYDTRMMIFRTDFALKGEKRDVKGVILHEIAHVLAGFRSDHNRYWEKIAYEIGAIVYGIIKDKYQQ